MRHASLDVGFDPPVRSSDTGDGARRPWLHHRKAIVGASSFAAVTALVGAVQLIASRNGSDFFPLRLIDHTPFRSFVGPALLLGVCVGGSSATSAILTWRRLRGAIGATLLAGGALSVWILAEAAMMRTVDALHVVFGALGLAILALGVDAGWRSERLRHRWVIAVTAAETLGILVPVGVGVFAARAGLSASALAGAVIVAGGVEGATRGRGQARAFPFDVDRPRFVVASALGAVVAWASAMGAVALTHGSSSIFARVVTWPVAVAVALLAVGGAPALVLRRSGVSRGRWLGWTTLAWALALPCGLAAMLFVDETTPLASELALWASSGAVMAYVIASITWRGVRRPDYRRP